MARIGRPSCFPCRFYSKTFDGSYISYRLHRRIYMGKTLYEELLRLKAEKEFAAGKIVPTPALAGSGDITAPQRMPQAPLLQPTELFEGWSKHPDHCIGGSCSWFKFDGKPMCTVPGGPLLFSIRPENARCPHNRWRLFTPKHAGQGLEPCPVCASDRWWRPKVLKGRWICAVCHPPALAHHLCEFLNYPPAN